jgi:hypothetical protein
MVRANVLPPLASVRCLVSELRQRAGRNSDSQAADEQFVYAAIPDGFERLLMQKFVKCVSALMEALGMELRIASEKDVAVRWLEKKFNEVDPDVLLNAIVEDPSGMCFRVYLMHRAKTVNPNTLRTEASALRSALRILREGETLLIDPELVRIDVTVMSEVHADPLRAFAQHILDAVLFRKETPDANETNGNSISRIARESILRFDILALSSPLPCCAPSTELPRSTSPAENATPIGSSSSTEARKKRNFVPHWKRTKRVRRNAETLPQEHFNEIAWFRDQAMEMLIDAQGTALSFSQVVWLRRKAFSAKRRTLRVPEYLPKKATTIRIVSVAEHVCEAINRYLDLVEQRFGGNPWDASNQTPLFFARDGGYFSIDDAPGPYQLEDSFFLARDHAITQLMREHQLLLREIVDARRGRIVTGVDGNELLSADGSSRVPLTERAERALREYFQAVRLSALGSYWTMDQKTLPLFPAGDGDDLTW